MSNTFNFYGNINIIINNDCNNVQDNVCIANINSIVLDFATGLIFNIEGSIGENSQLIFNINNSLINSGCTENINSVVMELNKIQNLVGNSGTITLQLSKNDCNNLLCEKTINYKTDYIQIPVVGPMATYSPKYIANCENRTFVDLQSTSLIHAINPDGTVNIFAQSATDNNVIAYYSTCNGQVDNLILLKVSNNNCPPSDIIATRCEGTTYITTLADGNCGTYEKFYPNHENCI